jgi:hypothetical protein
LLDHNRPSPAETLSAAPRGDVNVLAAISVARKLSTAALMKFLTSISSLILAGLWGAVLPITAQVNVTQEPKHLSRDGLYIDSAFTRAAAANVRRDLNFNGTISGNVYAQPRKLDLSENDIARRALRAAVDWLEANDYGSGRRLRSFLARGRLFRDRSTDRRKKSPD